MLDDRVAVFWDFENCSISFKSPDFNIVDRIRDVALQYGRIVSFKVYGEVKPSSKPSSTSSRIFSQLQCAGASTTHTPHNGFKEVADKMMLVDMMLFAMDNNPPAVIVLITGDKDFAYILSILRFRGYKTVLIAPSAAHASVINRAQFLHDWEEEILGVARLPSPPSRRSTQNSDSTMMSSSTGSSAEDSVLGIAGATSTVNLSTTIAASAEKREQPSLASLPAAAPVIVPNVQEAAEVEPDIEPEFIEKQASASTAALPSSLPDPVSYPHTEDVRPPTNEQPETNTESDPDLSLELSHMAPLLINNQSRVTFAATESEERPSRAMHREPVGQRLNRALRANSPSPHPRPGRPVSPPPSVPQQDNSSFSLLNAISRMPRLMFGNKKLSRASSMAAHSTKSLTGHASCSNFSLADVSVDGYASDSSSSGSDSDAAAKDAVASTLSITPSPQSNMTSVTSETKPATAASTELQPTLNVASSGNVVDGAASVSPPRTTTSATPVSASHPASSSSATSVKANPSTDKPQSIIILSNETTTKAAPSANKSSSPSPPVRPVIKPTAVSQISQAATSSKSSSSTTNAPSGQKSNSVESAGQPPSKATTYKPPIVAEKSTLPIAAVPDTGLVTKTATQSSTSAVGAATQSVTVPTTSAAKPPAPLTAPIAPAPTPSMPTATTSTIPVIYATLAATLENARIKGNPRVPRTVLGQEILQKNPHVYTAAGIPNTSHRFKNYIAKAESAGIVVLGGQAGSAWVSLHSDWIGRVKAT